MQKITPAEVERYLGYRQSLGDKILVHGTVSTFVDDIAKEGMLVRSKDFPTVHPDGVFTGSQSMLEYEWYEPRGNGENANVFLQVPKEVIEAINNKGLPLSQETIFDEICEDIELEVPDTPETRQNFIMSQNEQKFDNRLGDITSGVVGPKFSKWGAKPGTKYTHVGVPPKYICAIANKNKVFYVSESLVEFANGQEKITENNLKTNKQKQEETMQQEIQVEALTLDEAEKLF